MPLSLPEQKKLAALIRQRTAVQKSLAKAIVAEKPIATLIEKLDAILADISNLEVTAIGRSMAAGWSRDRAMKAAALRQKKAGAALLASVKASAKSLKGKSWSSPSAFARALRTQIKAVSRKLEGEIVASAIDMGVLAGTRAREQTIASFGKSAAEVFAAADKGIGVSFGVGVERKTVDSLWAAERKVFRATMASNSTALETVAKDFIELGKSAVNSVDGLKAAGFPKQRTLKWAAELEAAAADAAAGIPGAADGFRAAARKARHGIRNRTKTRGMSRRFIADLERAVKAADGLAVDRAVETMYERRTSYNAARAMRTLTNETYRRGMNESARNSPHVYAMRRILSGSHKVMDYCDGVASDDIGLGPGVYPIGHLPLEHHAGLCRDELVIDDNFLKRGGDTVLTFTSPPGLKARIQATGAGGSIAKKMDALGRKTKGNLSDAKVRSAMRSFGAKPRPKIKLRETPIDKAAPNSMTGALAG